MARLRLPLYAKMLLWFLMNLLLLLLLGYGFMRMQFRLGLDWMLAGPTGARIEQLGNTLRDTLELRPEGEWSDILKQYNAAQGITFTLFSSDGRQLVGDSVEVPKEVRARLVDKRSPIEANRPPAPRPPPPASGAPPPPPPPKPRFMLRSDHPTRYWAGVHLDLFYREGELRLPLTLVMISDTLIAGGVFFDPWPWVALVACGLLLSVLVWLPFVSGMTRAIQRMNAAARRIAHGRFEVRVPDQRGDELGELAMSVNDMAGQLGVYVAQQRRITADVAHELCSPIARMQMALGVVEQRGTPEQATYLKKLDTELQHMAKLVEEVLAFSKAETLPERAQPEDIQLLDLANSIVAREANGGDVRVNVPAELQVHTLREALDRALGNVLRNAVRYAGAAGPIYISGHRRVDGRVSLCVTDLGPGVPPETLGRLFEPFYRPEVARARHTGGSGLGLAIVKRCIEACGGTVTARLRDPTGLEVELQLAAG